MGRKRRPNEPPSYQPAPTVPAELAARLELVSQVIAGTLSMSEGARRADISRNNFQTLVHRTKQAMLEALAPRPSGPRPTPEREARLAAEVERLARENERLTERAETIDRLLGVAGEMLKGQRTPLKAPRSSTRSSTSSTPSSTDATDEDPDPEPARALARVTTMRDRGLPAELAAAIVGRDPSTLRRWRRRRMCGDPLRRRRTRAAVSELKAAEIRARVRDLGRLIGAESLAHAVPGVSRRQAAVLKADELRAIERERKQTCGRVEVLMPDVIRGFDALYLQTIGDRQYALYSADACAPYGTTLDVVPAYDSNAVRHHLERDFANNGVPLVSRHDRAACHATQDVASLLHANGVLVLHGPPHHPRYYGQLERQNRDLRVLFDRLEQVDARDLQDHADALRLVLNERWPRATLNWHTPSSVWKERQPVSVDRDALRDDVAARRAHMREAGVTDDLAARLAIEHALVHRGLLRIQPPRQVLRG